MSHNQELLVQEQHKIQLANGRMASQTGVLVLKQNELNTLFPEMRREIDLLKVSMSKVRSVSMVSFEQHKSLVAPLKDSIAIIPGSPLGDKGADTLHFSVFSYHDAFYDVSGFADKKQQFLNISSRDTMTQVVYQRRKKPWLWVFSPKVYEQRVYFKNPHAHIYYSRTINIQR